MNVSSPSVPLKKLTDIGADSFAWADDGKTITWSVGDMVMFKYADPMPLSGPGQAIVRLRQR